MPKIKTVTVRAFLQENVFPELERLGADIEVACNILEEKGYAVISIVPIQQGHWTNEGAAGFGYSTTQGVIITGRMNG